MAAFIAVLALVREPRVLQRYTYTLGAVGLVLLAIPALLPAILSEVNGAKVWIIIGGFSIQPGEFAKLALAVFFAGYLVAKRDVLVAGGPAGARHRPAPRRGTSARCSSPGAPACSSWSSRPTSARPRCSSACSWSCCTSPPSARRGCSSASCCSCPAPTWPASCSAHVGERFNIWLHPFAAAATSTTVVLPAGAGPVRDGLRRDPRHRARPRPAVLHPAGAERLHLHRVRRGTRPHRPDGDPADLRPDRAARACARRSRSATRSPSCWPPACRSCSRCRSSSSSAA